MFEILTVVIFLWLLAKTVSMAWKLTWGMARIAASILIGLAVPLLVVCLVFAGGLFLVLPLAVIGIAFAVLKACL